MGEMYRDYLVQEYKDKVYDAYEKLPYEAKKLTISEALDKAGELNEYTQFFNNYTKFFNNLNRLVLEGITDFDVNSNLEEVVNNLRGIGQKDLPYTKKKKDRKECSER